MFYKLIEDAFLVTKNILGGIWEKLSKEPFRVYFTNQLIKLSNFYLYSAYKVPFNHHGTKLLFTIILLEKGVAVEPMFLTHLV